MERIMSGLDKAQRRALLATRRWLTPKERKRVDFSESFSSIFEYKDRSRVRKTTEARP